MKTHSIWSFKHKEDLNMRRTKMGSSARPCVSLFYFQMKRSRRCKAFLNFSKTFLLHFVQVEQVGLELSNNIVWHFPQHICCIHRIFPKCLNYPNVNSAHSDLHCVSHHEHLDIWTSKRDPITNFTNSCRYQMRPQKFLFGNMWVFSDIQGALIIQSWINCLLNFWWNFKEAMFFMTGLITACSVNRGPIWKEAGV